VLVLAFIVGIVTAALLRVGGVHASAQWIGYAIGFGGFYVLLLLIGLYVMVRMNNRAWSATSFPGVRIKCAMRVRSYLGLQVVNVLLTLLTLGLFRPFAAVRTWRYRTAHVTVDAPDGFEQAVLAARRPAVAAAGDGVADFLGVDLSW
jgi:uncharacterized membrane protein YjgN (DUF898 family)